jgi:hypothetical protein
MIPIYVIYDVNDEVVVAFPSRQLAVDYGYSVLGDGWEYNIIEMSLQPKPQNIDNFPP